MGADQHSSRRKRQWLIDHQGAVWIVVLSVLWIVGMAAIALINGVS